jgi:hypothetical protein
MNWTVILTRSKKAEKREKAEKKIIEKADRTSAFISG